MIWQLKKPERILVRHLQFRHRRLLNSIPFDSIQSEATDSWSYQHFACSANNLCKLYFQHAYKHRLDHIL